MDFDEYDYLEKTVENPEPVKEKESANGGEAVKAAEKERSRSLKHRSDDIDRDADHHRSSKRSSRADDEPRDREQRERERDRDRHRERETRLDRSEKDQHRSSRERRDRDWEERNGREKDKERDKERDRGRDRDRDRDREREREKEKDREREKEKDREREKEKEKEKEKDREKEKDKDGERERSRRSRSRSERHRSDRDRDVVERDREKSRDGEFKERERERDFRDRDGRRYKEKKEEGPEPEADPERDQRTVFAFQISLKADERDVYEFFSRAGKVRDVRLIMDRNSRRSKGVGYIEFYDAMSVPMAIALSGQPLLGQAVMVKPSEAEKNLVPSSSAVGGVGGLIGPYSGGARRLYVGNLHFNITEDQLRQVFEPFGAVELVQLPLDPETGQCKGFGFVQFVRLEDARAAQSLNGQLDIAGRIIKVSAVSDQVGMQDVGANAGDFDDDDGGGLALNARSRALLMQKLDRSGTTSALGTAAVNGPALTVPTAPLLGVAPVVPPLLPALAGQAGAIPGLPNPTLPIVPAPVPVVDPIGIPSECLLLKNMFDPKNETDPDFAEDIKDDVQDECSKYGAVKHIFVDKDSAGFVYLRFDAMTSAMSAQRALHGRWFAGKLITATYMSIPSYEAKFPNSR